MLLMEVVAASAVAVFAAAVLVDGAGFSAEEVIKSRPTANLHGMKCKGRGKMDGWIRGKSIKERVNIQFRVCACWPSL